MLMGYVSNVDRESGYIISSESVLDTDRYKGKAYQGNPEVFVTIHFEVRSTTSREVQPPG